jgi:tight adherence protein C
MSPHDILGPGAPASLPIAVGVGLANFLAILLVLRSLSPKETLAARARSHARRRQELRSALLTTRRAERVRPMGLVRRLVHGLKLHRGSEARKGADRLAQAGWRSPDAVLLLQAARLACPLAVGLLAYLAAPAVVAHLDATMRALAGAAGLAAGAWLPSLMLKNAIQKRRRKIQKAMPDALDLFVICAEAGLSLDAAVARIAREIGPSAPEIADELGLTAIELGFLPDRREALMNLARRTGTADIRSLVNTLVQTERYGTPLGRALRVLASEFREARMMRAEEKAARLPAVLTVPMIAFILPPLFVVLIGPAIVQVAASGLH